MRRRLFTLATAVSLLACAAMAAIWWLGLGGEFDSHALVTTHDIVGTFSTEGTVTFWWLSDLLIDT